MRKRTAEVGAEGWEPFCRVRRGVTSRRPVCLPRPRPWLSTIGGPMNPRHPLPRILRHQDLLRSERLEGIDPRSAPRSGLMRSRRLGSLVGQSSSMPPVSPGPSPFRSASTPEAMISQESGYRFRGSKRLGRCAGAAEGSLQPFGRVGHRDRAVEDEPRPTHGLLLSR